MNVKQSERNVKGISAKFIPKNVSKIKLVENIINIYLIHFVCIRGLYSLNIFKE